MDRNLGAAYVAESATDYLAYASLYQWGRLSDGHQLINWNSSTSGTPVNGSTTTKSTTNTPANALFITSGSDWRSTQNDGLWQAGSQVNNPCPAGFRVPTIAEWEAETNITNIATAFEKLKLVVAGKRQNSDATLGNAGTGAGYWSATVNGTDANSRGFNSISTNSNSDNRGSGFSVRCLKY
jgi:hypothetical protein